MTAMSTPDAKPDHSAQAAPQAQPGSAAPPRPAIAYVGASLPVRSETFVYRELFGLRSRGWPVTAVSVHKPQHGLGDPALDQLADEAVPVYGRGGVALLADAFKQCLTSPIRSIKTLTRGKLDALFARDVKLSSRPKVMVQCVAGLALAYRLKPYNIAWLHAHMAHVPTTIAMYAAQALGVGFSFTGHAADLTRDRCLLSTKLRRAGFAPCISHWHRGFYDEQAPAAQGDAHRPIVRCAVDTDEFAPTPREAGDTLHILAVGRLVPKKGFDVLIDALASTPGVAVTLVGDGPEQPALAELIEAHGLSDRIAMVGAKDNHMIRGMLGEHDAFVLPCRVATSGDRDGIPVVLMEAMAAGLAVVSGDLPTIRELVEDGQTGLMVDPENPDALPNALAKLRDDRELRARLASAGRRRVEDEFSTHANLDRLETALRRVLDGDDGEA